MTVAKRVMSSPHSAIRTWAAWDVDARDRAQQLDQLPVRSQDGGDPIAEVGDRGVERVDVREQLRDHHTVVLDLEAAGERLAQLRNLLAHPGRRFIDAAVAGTVYAVPSDPLLHQP